MSAQIVLEKVGVRLPNRALFEDINWTLYEGSRVTLAGRNGSGKSTLMKILSGDLEPSTGTRTVVGGKRLRIGFLNQSVLDSAVMEVQEKGAKSQSPVEYILQRLAADPDRDEIEVATMEWEVHKLLTGLGFQKSWLDAPISRLSGGWLLRVFIGAALAEQPEVLLLDEPTNHLDLSSIQWLEEFLQRDYKGSLVLISHDISLQQKTTSSLAVLHGAKFFFQKHQNNYLAFRESLGEEDKILEKQIEALQKKIDDNLAFVQRFRAKASLAARAQSKLKAAEAQEEEKAALKERLERIRGTSYNLHFRFRHSGAGGKFPLAVENLSFRYAEDAPPIIKGVSFDIRRGERVAIIGDNGAGKTTLLNLLGDRLQPQEGRVTQGHALSMGYFGQHQLDELRLDATVLENVRDKAVGVGFEELRGWLGAFGFSTEEEVDKKAEVLSGGERARLALLRILVTRINVCLLDEPTNHLDIETKALLKEAIKAFEGTVVLVSHDRDFLDGLADRIVYLTSDHELTDHFGDLASFFAKYPHLVRHLEGRAKPSQAQEEGPKKEPQSAPKVDFKERKRLKNRAKAIQKRVEELEILLQQLGDRKTELVTISERPDFYSESISEEQRQKTFEKIRELDSQISGHLAEWEKASLEMETIREAVPELVE